MAKKKKLLKKLAKAALIGGGLYAATRGLKGRADKLTEGDIGLGLRAPSIPDSPYIKKKVVPKTPPVDEGIWGSPWGGKKGGRATAKHGGRTRKQFGGGLNRPVGGVGSTARRDMRSGYYPSDMGMRGGPMYKKGGRVKSRGVAKRGGGAEIK